MKLNKAVSDTGSFGDKTSKIIIILLTLCILTIIYDSFHPFLNLLTLSLNITSIITLLFFWGMTREYESFIHIVKHWSLLSFVLVSTYIFVTS